MTKNDKQDKEINDKLVPLALRYQKIKQEKGIKDAEIPLIMEEIHSLTKFLINVYATKINLRLPADHFEELKNEGYLGLVSAIDKLDTSKSHLGFIKIRIKGRMQDYLRKIDSVSRDVRNKLNKLKKTQQKHLEKNINDFLDGKDKILDLREKTYSDLKSNPQNIICASQMDTLNLETDITPENSENAYFNNISSRKNGEHILFYFWEDIKKYISEQPIRYIPILISYCLIETDQTKAGLLIHKEKINEILKESVTSGYITKEFFEEIKKKQKKICYARISQIVTEIKKDEECFKNLKELVNGVTE